MLGVLAAIRTGVMRAMSRTATSDACPPHIRLDLQKPPMPTALTLIECPSNGPRNLRAGPARALPYLQGA